ncbi:MAG: hypothetical protein QOG20_3870, partial [Pseudonocardiales bacterium]|nr:hypothetical protein [Pseudonocardiales bacterium]
MEESSDRDREADESSADDLSEDDLDIEALVAVWKDDELLDAAGRAPIADDLVDVPFDASADQELLRALLAWRREIEAGPGVSVAPERPADVAPAPAPARRRRGMRVPLATAAAAAVVIVFTGVAAYGARPDDALWTVTQVLYSQHADSVQAAQDIATDQSAAGAAMASGHARDARAALRSAAAEMPSVSPEDGRASLQARQHDLVGRLDSGASRAPDRTQAHGPDQREAQGPDRPEAQAPDRPEAQTPDRPEAQTPDRPEAQPSTGSPSPSPSPSPSSSS